MPRFVVGRIQTPNPAQSPRVVVGRTAPQVGMMSSTDGKYPVNGAMRQSLNNWIYDKPEEYGMTEDEATRDWNRIEKRIQRFYSMAGGYGDDIGWKSGVFGHGFNFQYAL
jgi:hypothetical protein